MIYKIAGWLLVVVGILAALGGILVVIGGSGIFAFLRMILFSIAMVSWGSRLIRSRQS